MSDRGTYRCYVEKNFQPQTLEMIGQANKIVEEYEAAGFSLTLRQLYYQFVARGLIENRDSSYDRLGSAINNGRLAGLVSWTAIEDRTRGLSGLRTYDSPAEAMQGVAEGYRRDLWADQPMRPEVWIEKEALVDVVAGICNEMRVDFFACRGYNSQSEQWRAGRRLARYVGRGQTPVIFHLGDHDPSGVDMTRDNADRLSMFAGVRVAVERLALNMDQIERLRPPPNPAKVTDSRYESYRREYGDESWELDALDPRTLQGLIRDAVYRLRVEKIWEDSLLREEQEREELRESADELGRD